MAMCTAIYRVERQSKVVAAYLKKMNSCANLSRFTLDFDKKFSYR